jgi:hypothetical protein
LSAAGGAAACCEAAAAPVDFDDEPHAVSTATAPSDAAAAITKPRPLVMVASAPGMSGVVFVRTHGVTRTVIAPAETEMFPPAGLVATAATAEETLDQLHHLDLLCRRLQSAAMSAKRCRLRLEGSWNRARTGP